jgi:molecular chaperone HscB
MNENSIDYKEVEILSKKNAFALFNLNLDYNINKKILKQQYLLLQKKYHPDNYLMQTKSVIDLMSNLSIYINQQYQLLLNPVDRSILLLKILNYSLDLNDTSKLTKEFLFTQMELQEKIFDAHDGEQLSKLVENLNKQMVKIEGQITDNFLKQHLDDVAILTLELSFYAKIYSRMF